jgi:hypothetical protein
MKILKNIPIPQKEGKVGGFAYTARRMTVGECVICDNFKDSQKLYAALRVVKKSATTRRLPDGKYGVWVI